MRLAIDAGNTRIKWALGEGPVQAIAHRGCDLAARLGASWQGLPRPQAVHVASVAGEAVDLAIEAAARACWPGVALDFLHSRAACCGVRLAYAEPQRFGVDRLAALVAAHAREKGRPLIVVDAGSAITVDAMDAAGRHLGGLILPGLGLLQESLPSSLAGQAAPGGDPALALQADTQAALAAGVRCMHIGGVLRAIEVARAEAGMEARLYLTGGDAPMLAEAVGAGHVLHPRLVLDGVLRMGEVSMPFAPAGGMA